MEYFYKYDFASRNWTKLSTTRLFSGQCFAQYTGPKTNKTDHIYLYGKSENGNTSPELASFNFSQVEVLSTNSPQVPTDGGCTIDSESNFYVFGGRVAGACENKIHVFSTKDKVWKELDTSKSTELPTPRHGTSLISANETHLYMFGGICGETVSDNAVWEMELETGKWTKINNNSSLTPPPRSYASLFFDFSSTTPTLILFGGKGDANSTLKDLWLFNLTSATWMQITTNDAPGEWPTGREKFGSAYSGGRMLIFGGLGGLETTNAPNNQIWKLVLNYDCFSRRTCSDCVTTLAGCGWCNENEVGYQCIAGSAYGPYSSSSCNVTKNGTSTNEKWTTDFLT